jgi:hypothetical protein
MADQGGELAFLQFEIEVFDDCGWTFWGIVGLPETI